MIGRQRADVTGGRAPCPQNARNGACAVCEAQETPLECLCTAQAKATPEAEQLRRVAERPVLERVAVKVVVKPDLVGLGTTMAAR